MAWEMYQKKEVPHKCELYDALQTVAEGDIIKCTDCGKLWECYLTDGGMQWDPTPRVLRFRTYTERTSGLERYGR